MILAAILFSYLFGGIPVGFILAKQVRGIDIREYGSRNIGATNVGRVIGWKYGFVALLLDALKGAIPVISASYIDSPYSLTTTEILLGSVAILGHTFTPFLHFKGGKGVATALGVYMTLVPIVTVCAIVIFFIVYKISGFVSLGSILATLSMPLWYFGSSIVLPSADYQPIIFFVLVATFFLITYSHRENIKRLVSGKELRASENAK
ncbi:glycerol-3-phosphate 1-O-acyltransferase PlsY [Leptospira jelokensis]|uniref:Glycerol-3-phosphate acyltransferase n=1 Tax=Leptospira jelokensis TaxID=2484931 RepID=A0A4Z1A9B0_9LEPT|nr:glycerol-3-phosphate 1-O-acyltransferase PlsY [Leptospira jelokensis]TGL72388.1 glycerol-3-phosphate acyltransferase [Leptospira jelokensis]TGM00325.1 glycerol-3-phosphate acyltransferase [Leptospira jelokensis]